MKRSLPGHLQTLGLRLWSDMDTTLAERLQKVISAVDSALTAHESGGDAPYSVPFLKQVRGELIQMRDQWPSFPFRFGRFVVDWPETELGGELLEVGQLFERRRKRAL